MASTSSIMGLGTSGIRGYGGLASGLDRDSLIEQMTLGTRKKISVQKQRKQSLQWEQESYRNITSKLLSFVDNYMSLTSSKGLYNSSLFSPSGVNALGENSKFVSAVGNSTIADKLKILGVKQLAENASATTGAVIGSSTMETNLDLEQETEVQNLAEKSLQIVYGRGNSPVNVKFMTGEYEDEAGNTQQYDYSTPENAVRSMNQSLKQSKDANGEPLSKSVEFFYDSAHNVIGIRGKGEANSNYIAVKGGNASEFLGFDPNNEQELLAGSDGTKALGGAIAPDLTKMVSNREKLSGKSVDFTYNGVTKSITFGQYDAATTMEDVKNDLQSKLNHAFGTGRIEVQTDAAAGSKSGKLSFKTTLPEGGTDDSSVLKVTGGDLDARTALDMVKGGSNRLNTRKSLEEIAGDLANPITDMDSFLQNSKINGRSLADMGVTRDMSVADMMEKINSDSEAHVEISFMESSDKFMIKSTEDGASGKIKVEGDWATSLLNGVSTAEVRGKDAMIAVDDGDGQQKLIRRGSNTFDLQGLTVTVNGTFGTFDADNKVTSDSAVTFKPEMNTDKALSTVSDFVKDYNALIELVNDEYTTRPNRDYFPLTDEQKKEMSEDEIKAWEKEAKKGLLFNDGELSSLSSDLQLMLVGLDSAALEEIGITTSREWTDRGKLVFDEEKFKTAMEKDPETVAQLFANDDRMSGLVDKMDNTIQKYAKKMGAYKGSLVQKAGALEAPLSLTQNDMYKQINAFDEAIEKLTATLESEQDRYIKQFTTLENLISQMNSQSSWLSSQFG